MVSTDIAIHVPKGTYGRSALRSELAVKHAIDIGAGVIDKDYRGPISKKKLRHDALHLHMRLGAPCAHPTFHPSSVGALHLAFCPVRPQISPPALFTPCPHPHLPTRL